MTAGELIAILSLLPADMPVVLDEWHVDYVAVVRGSKRDLYVKRECEHCGETPLVREGRYDIPRHVRLGHSINSPEFARHPDWKADLRLYGSAIAHMTFEP